MAGTGSRANAQLVDALVQASFVTMAVLARVGAENDMSLTQMRVLGILRDRRPRMADLAAYLGLEKSTMSGLVDRAEKRGLLRREANRDDARAIDVVLTESGSALAAAAHETVVESLESRLGALATGERQQLARLLARIQGSEAGALDGA
jgi:DNA-binding MarR family transcriptional regulator